MTKFDRISPKVIERLTKYLRCLESYDQEAYISSEDLATSMGYTAAKVRKDLSNFGEFGIRGKGYHVRDLYGYIEKILGVNKINNVILIGIGRLGTALLAEPEFTKESFKIIGLFDSSKEKIGKDLNKMTIRDIKDLPMFVEENDISIAILTVPKAVTQDMVDFLVKCGIRAVLNFAPVKVDVPPEVIVETMDLYAKLQEVNFWKEKKETKKKKRKVEKEPTENV